MDNAIKCKCGNPACAVREARGLVAFCRMDTTKIKRVARCAGCDRARDQGRMPGRCCHVRQA